MKHFKLGNCKELIRFTKKENKGLDTKRFFLVEPETKVTYLDTKREPRYFILWGDLLTEKEIMPVIPCSTDKGYPMGLSKSINLFHQIIKDSDHVTFKMNS